jgi:GH24 family phage-related lysozyme (muramidase)
VLGASRSSGETDSFDALLSQFETDPELVENSWLYRDPSVSRGVGHGVKSSRKISDRAIDMIVKLEVGSKQRYEQRYQAPIWPKGKSGVTIGIGYDLKFASKQILHRDWDGLIDQSAIKTLETVVRLSGAAAKMELPSVSSVRIPWTAAQSQFLAFLPYPTAQAESIFSNSHLLRDDSFGALVSLVYNRGSAIPRGDTSRTEMVRIHALMEAKQFNKIPAQIRSMKRLWLTPDSRGLVIRRELEARLFEMGMAG